LTAFVSVTASGDSNLLRESNGSFIPHPNFSLFHETATALTIPVGFPQSISRWFSPAAMRELMLHVYDQDLEKVEFEQVSISDFKIRCSNIIHCSTADSPEMIIVIRDPGNLCCFPVTRRQPWPGKPTAFVKHECHPVSTFLIEIDQSSFLVTFHSSNVRISNKNTMT
jgi:hypothetical protein